MAQWRKAFPLQLLSCAAADLASLAAQGAGGHPRAGACRQAHPARMATRVPIVGRLLAFLRTRSPRWSVVQGAWRLLHIRAAHKRLTFSSGPMHTRRFSEAQVRAVAFSMQRADVGAVWRARALCLTRITHAPMLHWPDAICVVPLMPILSPHLTS